MHTILIRTSAGDSIYRAAGDERLLDAGLRAGYCMPYECATGTCGQCRAKVVQGTYKNLWPDAPAARNLQRESGEVLMCQTTACSTVELRLPKGTELRAKVATLPSRQTAHVTRLRYLNDDVIEMRLVLPEPMYFLPGQFVLVAVPGLAGYRAYSLVNHDIPSSALTLLVKRKIDGGFSKWLFGAACEGLAVDLFGPLGKATFEADVMQDIICIAGGSGIAGMMSILGGIHGTSEPAVRRSDLFFGVRSANDLIYAADLNRLAAASHGQLRVTIALSEIQPNPSLGQRYPALNFEQGMVHEVAMNGLRANLDTPTAFLAGPPIAVDAGIRMLLKQKFPLHRIRFDRFG